MTTWDSRPKLYDSISLAALLYGTDIWGHNYFKILEGAKDFTNHFFGVHSVHPAVL